MTREKGSKISQSFNPLQNKEAKEKDSASLRHAEAIAICQQDTMNALKDEIRKSLMKQWEKVESFASEPQQLLYDRLIKAAGYRERNSMEISQIIQSIKSNFQTQLQLRITEVSGLYKAITHEDKTIKKAEEVFSAKSQSYSRILKTQISDVSRDIAKNHRTITTLKQALENAKKKGEIIKLPTSEHIKDLRASLTTITEDRTKAIKNMKNAHLSTINKILQDLQESTEKRRKKYDSWIQWGDKSKKQAKLTKVSKIQLRIKNLKAAVTPDAVTPDTDFMNLRDRLQCLQNQVQQFKTATTRPWCSLFKSGSATKNEDKYMQDFEKQRKVLDAELQSMVNLSR